jgi:rhodanese-related sulfurtransferase
MSLEISTADLQSSLAGSNPPILVEVLPPESYRKEHLPGAINLPLEGFAAAAKSALPDPRAEVVLYCASVTCANSHLAAKKLEELGYQHVRVYSGGKAAWREAGLAFEAAKLTA